MVTDAKARHPPAVAQPGFRAPLTPLIARRALRYELSRMCDNSPVTHSELGARLGTSRASVSQILAGVNLPSRAALEVIVRHLGQVHRLPDLVPLLDQARHARGRLPRPCAVPDRELELGLEAKSEAVTAVSFSRVPSLLVSRTYLRSISGDKETAELHDLERRRLVLAGDDPIKFTWFSDEPFLRRFMAVTPADLVREQIGHLLMLSEAGVVRIRLLPIDVTTPVPPASFRVFRFSDGYDCALEDTVVATHYTEDLNALTVYNGVIARLEPDALSAASSHRLLRQTLLASS
jgi:transcriptional regulator with XRE-family HTH domain